LPSPRRPIRTQTRSVSARRLAACTARRRWSSGLPPPDPYAHSKRLGEEACRLHRAPTLVVRLPSVYGPGQVAWEGATGAIASFAARALAGEPIVIVGDPESSRDLLYVEGALGAIAAL